MTVEDRARDARITALLEARKNLAWSTMRTARVNRELTALGYQEPSKVAEKAAEVPAKADRATAPAQKAAPEKAVPAKRTYTKRATK